MNEDASTASCQAVCPGSFRHVPSDLHALCEHERIFDIDPEIANRCLERLPI
jgi:hypothetical protein